MPFAFALAGGAAVLTGLLASSCCRSRSPPGSSSTPSIRATSLRLAGEAGRRRTWIAALGAAAAIALAVILRPRSSERGAVAGIRRVLFVLPIAVGAARDWTPSENRRAGPLTPAWCRRSATRVPDGGIVFSDLETSYRIAAAAPVYVASAPPAHVADTKDNRPHERRDARFASSGPATSRSPGATARGGSSSTAAAFPTSTSPASRSTATPATSSTRCRRPVAGGFSP